MALDLGLGALDRLGDDAVLDRHVLVHAEPLHQPGDPLGPEAAHQLVFERDVEAGRAGVALAAGATAELVVDAARLVALGADDVQTAGLGDAGAEDDVGAAAGHVGGDRHRLRLTGLGDDRRLALVLLGVEHLVRNALRGVSCSVSRSEVSIEVVPTSTGRPCARASP